MRRMRIIGDLGEIYEVDAERWGMMVRACKERDKLIRLTLQESYFDYKDMAKEPKWETVAEFKGDIECGR